MATKRTRKKKKAQKKRTTKRPAARRRAAAEPVVEQLAIALPPEQMWQALTSPRVLGDIVLGRVELDPRPGKPFLWRWTAWQRAAPGRLREKDYTWRGRVLDVVPGATLVLGGAGESVAVLTVKGAGPASLVTVVQGESPGIDLDEYRVGWADFLLKLKTRLEPPAIPGALYVRALVSATPNEILRAFLSAAAMSRLLPGKAKVQARPGGRYEWRWRETGAVASGEVLEFEKGHRLVLSWLATTPPTEVRLSALKTPLGAVVSVEHLHLEAGRVRAAGQAPPARDRESYRRLWAHLLERVRVYFHFGKKIRAS